MKNLFFTLLLSLIAFTVSAQDSAGPIVTFQESTYEFGDIHQGDVVEHIFKFTNTGDAPLVITNVTTTCGCTAPKWPKEPIAVGDEGEIIVRFNSRGKRGVQNKPITVYSNAKNTTRISITTNVLVEEKN
ncbi:DUF1573 domain-containing protein [Flammeovirga kamogawensis]|uniref:DUF1573 domain-containing protein n=1 Tax=Flammeovirga kamogawensis TaxID=373891 RepID=A0ABX8GT80_9BACT|nr:DUF1573 domain-containing protein [Flammeovirga kamogawensis]MBB6464027.1 hypothetical protein [Flammeovirga kamogawensis]QWG06140.1 DUF1573 domain-containing protein [Flammeovirga kamogawensis]TRX67972.1 DUF1573 domain-containing protein [Flammeovirga kamogawensis]